MLPFAQRINSRATKYGRLPTEASIFGTNSSKKLGIRRERCLSCSPWLASRVLFRCGLSFLLLLGYQRRSQLGAGAELQDLTLRRWSVFVRLEIFW
jgi:hypothetical protein